MSTLVAAPPMIGTALERRLAPMALGITDYARDPRACLWRARALQAGHRASMGYRQAPVPLLTRPDAQPKLHKSAMPAYGLTLLPAFQGSAMNACPGATAGCLASCLVTAGKGAMPAVERARAARRQFVETYPREAGVILAHEVAAALARHGGGIGLRLNVNSDIRWELIMPDAMRAWADSGARLYDYSKWRFRPHAAAAGLHITYSASERWADADIRARVASGDNVAVVFDAPKQAVVAACASGARWHGIPLTDGVSSDDRTLDPRGALVALSPLGRARADRTGFVRPWDVDA